MQSSGEDSALELEDWLEVVGLLHVHAMAWRQVLWKKYPAGNEYMLQPVTYMSQVLLFLRCLMRVPVDPLTFNSFCHAVADVSDPTVDCAIHEEYLTAQMSLIQNREAKDLVVEICKQQKWHRLFAIPVVIKAPVQIKTEET